MGKRGDCARWAESLRVGVRGGFIGTRRGSNRWRGALRIYVAGVFAGPCMAITAASLSIGRDPFVLRSSPRSREPIGWYRGLDHAAASRRRKLSPRFAGTHGEGGIPRGNRLHPIHVGKLRFSAPTRTRARTRTPPLPGSNLTRTTPSLSPIHLPRISLTSLLYFSPRHRHAISLSRLRENACIGADRYNGRRDGNELGSEPRSVFWADRERPRGLSRIGGKLEDRSGGNLARESAG